MKSRYVSLLASCLLIPFFSIAQNADDIADAQPKAAIEFAEPTFDFGTIESGEIVSYVFKFTNTGEYPLVITDAKGSCGCAVPFYPKVPIMPGETSEIEVSFNTTGKSGKQSKRVTITANTEPAQTFLTILAEVTSPAITAPIVADNGSASQKEKAIQAIKALDPNCMAIFPNPTTDVLRLELKDQIGRSASVDMHNAKGEKVLSQKIEHISSETSQFDVSKFLPGTYLITIRVDDMQPMTQCFVVTGK
jgi:hypothetical protein